MKNTNFNKIEDELIKLVKKIKLLIENDEFESCEDIISSMMKKYPHLPHPHNLYGILLEKQGNHVLAMKHFKAAWALDPTYAPSNHNLHIYGTFFSNGKCAYDEDDIPMDKIHNVNKYYDENGICHIERS